MERPLSAWEPFPRDGTPDLSEPTGVARLPSVTAARRRLRVAGLTGGLEVGSSGKFRWYRHPVWTLAATHRTVSAAADGQRLRMIGEPLWTARTRQESKEWARHESLINAALARANATLMCTYDTRVVGPDVVAEMAQTHPELVVIGGCRPSSSYADPVVFNAEADKSPLPKPPPSALRLRFSGVGQLFTLRDFVTSYAAWAGAAIQDVEQFVQAVDEVATNALEHGGRSGVLRVWTGPHTMSGEVSDTGTGLHDPLAGRLPTGRLAARGRGLWLARQLCDLVELRTSPAGTNVRLHLNLP